MYVSANPHTSLEAGDAFHHVVELWESDFDEDLDVVPPEAVREAAIEAHNQFPKKRLIVHFMQPHGPFIGSEASNKTNDKTVYWNAYRENLQYVLPFVDDIAEAINGKTVVTADHGQIKFTGFLHALGLSGHKARLRFPELVNVPWAVMKGDRREIEAGEVEPANSEEVEERLEDLGYL